MVALTPARPLRVVVLVKQVPDLEQLHLGVDGRLDRTGPGSEMDAYARRAAALGVRLADASGGSVTAVVMGPPSARDVLRECLAGGVHDAVHLTDGSLAGSDTLATARALAALLDTLGPVDLVLAGRASIDAETGQVPPQLAQLLGLPFAGGCRTFALEGEHLALGLEHDDRWVDVSVALPAVVTCAERLCDPLKLKEPERWSGIDEARISTVGIAALGPGSWGATASPTWVESVEMVAPEREAARYAATEEGAAAAVAHLVRRGALHPAPTVLEATVPARARPTGPHPLVVVGEPGDASGLRDLLGAAATLAVARASRVVAYIEEPAGGAASPEAHATLGAQGADEVGTWVHGATPVQVAAGLVEAVGRRPPWCVLLPASDWGREVGARLAAACGAGMTGDALALALDDDHRLVARKAAFGGGAEAVIRCRSDLHVATVRAGVLPRLRPRPGPQAVPTDPLVLGAPDSLQVRGYRRVDDSALLAARRVVGVGRGVAPEDLAELDPLLGVLEAELGASRKVTDAGWLPRSRQIGVTGHALAPRLYVAVGISGKVTHTAGVRGAGTIMAIDVDPAAPMLDGADVAIVGDWRVVVPLLVAALRSVPRDGADLRPSPPPAS